MSLAFYFVDPQGNDLELYVDTPEDTWAWEDGEVQIGSAFLDPNAFIEEHLTQERPDTATMGHVHMKVGDLKDAEAFYADILGLGSLSVHIDGGAALQELQERLDAADVGYESTDEGLTVQDPWGNTVRIIAQ